MSRFDQAIVFTPGTAQHHASQWFQWAAEATMGLPHPVIFAASDSSQLPTSLPAHVQTCGYIPFKDALPRCSLLVHHGGVGTTAAALRAGCSQLVCPSAFDQFHHADLVTQLGVGRALKTGPAAKPPISADQFRRLLSQLISDDAVKQAARERASHAADYQGQVAAASKIAEWIS